MVSVIRPFGEVASKPFSVGHTGSELKQLADYLKSLDGETRVVMEHTGRYYEPAAQFLHNEGIFVSAVNPKLIRDYGNNTLREVKTDKADARKIARYGLDNWAELRQHTPMDTNGHRHPQSDEGGRRGESQTQGAEASAGGVSEPYRLEAPQGGQNGESGVRGLLSLTEY